MWFNFFDGSKLIKHEEKKSQLEGNQVKKSQLGGTQVNKIRSSNL